MLKDDVVLNMKTAMKSGDTKWLGTLRLLLSEIKNKEIEKRSELSDSDVVQIIKKMIKQREESYQIYIDNNRNQLAEIELNEIKILENYLPNQMSEQNMIDIVNTSIISVNATKMSDMGKVMGVIKKLDTSSMDMSFISKTIKEKLS